MTHSRFITLSLAALIVLLLLMLKSYKEITGQSVLTLQNMKNHCEYKTDSKCILTFVSKE